MYGQDLYFVTVVAIIGFIFLVVVMILEWRLNRSGMVKNLNR